MRPINLSLGRRLSDALERWNAIDRVELLNGLRINITAPERCEALLGELRIVADIAEQFLAQRPDQRTHVIDLTVEDVTGYTVSEDTTQ